MPVIQNGESPVLQKRNSFRVYFADPLEGTGRIVTVNDQSVTLKKCFPLMILDLSVSGVRISSPLDFPVERKVVVELTFKLEQEGFTILGRILRKNRLDTTLEYGVEFIGVLPKDERRLAKALNAYQVKKIKVKKEQIPRLAVPKSVLKIIDLLPYRSYLINGERLLLAANKQTGTRDFLLGGKCFKEIFQRNDVCPFCHLKEITPNKDIIDLEVHLAGKKYLASWIWLETDLYLLHYLNS